MSQVWVDGICHRITHAELCEIDKAAEKAGITREQAAAKRFAPPKEKPAKDKAKKKG